MYFNDVNFFRFKYMNVLFSGVVVFKIFSSSRSCKECASAISFVKLFHRVDILLRRKSVLGSFPLFRSRESRKGCLLVRSDLFWSGQFDFKVCFYTICLKISYFRKGSIGSK